MRTKPRTSSFRIEQARFEHLFATEREELPRELRRPLGGLVNLHEVRPSGRIRRQRVLRELRVEKDRGQQVVEVVSHPAREPAERLEPLRQAQLLLEAPALGLRGALPGDVLKRDHRVADRAVLAEDRRPPHREGHRPISQPELHVLRHRALSAKRPGQRSLVRRIELVGARPVRPEERRHPAEAERPVETLARELLGGAIHELRVALGVDHEDADRHALEEVAQQGFPRAELHVQPAGRVVEARVLERDGRLRDQEAEHLDPLRRERVGREIVLEKERAQGGIPGAHGQAEDRLRPAARHVRVAREVAAPGRVPEDHFFAGPQRVPDDGLRDDALRIAAARRRLEAIGPRVELRLDAEAPLPLDEQGPTPGARRLHDDAHQALEQGRQRDLAREGLRRPDDARGVERLGQALGLGGVRRELRVVFVHGPHLPGGAPLRVPRACRREVRPRDRRLPPPREREARELRREGRVMKVSVRRRLLDGLVVEADRLAPPAAELGHLGRDEQLLVPEVHRRALRPASEEPAPLPEDGVHRAPVERGIAEAAGERQAREEGVVGDPDGRGLARRDCAIEGEDRPHGFGVVAEQREGDGLQHDVDAADDESRHRLQSRGERALVQRGGREARAARRLALQAAQELPHDLELQRPLLRRGSAQRPLPQLGLAGHGVERLSDHEHDLGHGPRGEGREEQVPALETELDRALQQREARPQVIARVRLAA